MEFAFEKNLIQQPQSVKVRCPRCFKLYVVNVDKITETRPDFQCKECLCFFYFEYPEPLKKDTQEILGLPFNDYTSEQKKNLNKLKKRPLRKKIQTLPQHLCPECLTPYHWGDTDCIQCGLSLKKKKENSSYFTNLETKQLWKNILKDYENDTLHERFLRACQVEENLSYAASKYQSILQANPHDQRAKKSMKRLQALVSLPFIKQNLTEKYNKKAHWPWVQFLLILSLGFVLTGFLIPFLVNLIGLGIALAFFSLALRFYFQKIF